MSNLWVVLNEQAACFNVYDGRSQKVAKNFLGNLTGYLVTDGHASFKSLASNDSGLILASDLRHARRKFKEAQKNYGPEVKPLLDHIGRHFQFAEKVKDDPLDERHRQGT